MNYVLLTPIQNEKENLINLKSTIMNQTVRPSLWTIIDSNSMDKSYDEAKRLLREFDWIEVIHQKYLAEKGYSHKNFAQAINEGYAHSSAVAKERRIEYSFVGKTDATPELEPDYFATLAEELQADPKIAFACGMQNLSIGERERMIHPSLGLSLSNVNDIRLYRREFFENVNGYPLTFSPDTVLLVKAIKGGWRAKVSERTYFTKRRLGGSKIGNWEGYRLKGKGMYELGYHPIIVMLNAGIHSVKITPHYLGIAILFGYWLGMVSRQEIIADKEVREYFRKEKLKEIIIALKSKSPGSDID